jgi:hypothetical protein
MKTAMQILAVGSWVGCLGSAVFYFQGQVTYDNYTTAFLIFSIVYFVSAITWMGMRRKGPLVTSGGAANKTS